MATLAGGPLFSRAPIRRLAVRAAIPSSGPSSPRLIACRFSRRADAPAAGLVTARSASPALRSLEAEQVGLPGLPSTVDLDLEVAEAVRQRFPKSIPFDLRDIGAE